MTTYYDAYPAEVVFAEVDFDTAGISTGIAIGTIPNGSVIVDAFVYVQTAFNAATTNLMSIGFSAGGTEFAITADIDLATAGSASAFNRLYRAFSQSPLTALRTIYVRYTQTGAAATTGKAHVVILYRR